MGIGDPGQEQFRDAITNDFRNGHIIAAMSPLMDMRREITGNDDFMNRTSIDSVTRNHFIKHLQRCDRLRRAITYNRSGESLSDIYASAISTAEIVGSDPATGASADSPVTGASADSPLTSGNTPFSSDEVQGAPGSLRQIPWALDGTNQNIPLNSKLEFRSSTGLLLLQAVDAAIVAWTRLESRFSTRFITVEDSMRMYQHYVQILEFLEAFTGDENRVDFAAGVLPTEEPRGAGNSPNMVSETAGASGISAT